jgi:hypothetical protein
MGATTCALINLGMLGGRKELRAKDLGALAEQVPDRALHGEGRAATATTDPMAR